MRHVWPAVVVAIALVAVAALGAPGAALAADWTGAPFPEGEIAQAVVQDSAGNIWATTLMEDGSYGHVEALWSNANEWVDVCAGLNWADFQWSNGLTSVGDKVFLTTTQGGCYARTAEDGAWHAIDSALRFTTLTAWDGQLWTGTDLLGMGRLDPETEQSEYVNEGLLVVMDNPGAARAYRSPSGNSDYLYVGNTVSPDLAATADFEGVTVYRLKRGEISWEDTGLTMLPAEGDLDLGGSEEGLTDWGVWHVVAMDGYVFCQVMIPVSGYGVDCYLYDEGSGRWSELTMPASDTGWYFLASGEPCFVKDGKFYFPTGFTSDGVVCDVLDPRSQTWRQDIKVEGTPWEPLVYTAQMIGDRLVVSSEKTEGSEGARPDEPSFVEAVPLPTELSTDPGVIGTNFGLTLLLALVFGFTATLFNDTLESNYERITKAFSPLARGTKSLGEKAAPPARRLGNWARAYAFRSEIVRRISARAPHVGRRWIRPLAVVLVAALIYAFLDPTFGFSGHGANIFFSLALSIAVVTFAYDGIQAIVSSRGYRIPAAVTLFPAAIGIAVFCVILSRATHFVPGYVYGFVGSLAFVGGLEPDKRKEGRMILIGALCLIAASMAAWFIAIPAAKAAVNGAWWAPGLESLCSAIFVAGLEGLFFGLLPLSVMDGGVLFRWSKVLWGILFGVVVFLFWHVLLNKNSKYGAAFGQSNTKVVLIFLACWTVATVAFYLAFHGPRRRRRVTWEPDQQAPGAWGPAPGVWNPTTGAWEPQPGAWSPPAPPTAPYQPPTPPYQPPETPYQPPGWQPPQ